MKVWVVLRSYDYEGEAIDAVFSTEALAEAWREKRSKDYADTRSICIIVEDWDLDEARTLPENAS